VGFKWDVGLVAFDRRVFNTCGDYKRDHSLLARDFWLVAAESCCLFKHEVMLADDGAAKRREQF
jgi:hypothetical protein